MKEISGVIRIFSKIYPGENLMNLYNLLSPFMLHPLFKVLQLVTVLITTILRSELSFNKMPIQLLLEQSLSISSAVKRMFLMKSSLRFNRINWAVRIEKISNEWAGCESELSYKYVQIVSSSDRWNLSRLISPHLTHTTSTSPQVQRYSVFLQQSVRKQLH